MTKDLIRDDVTGQFSDYLRDESRRTGSAESISFPESEDDIIEIVERTAGPITIQGARTGITGGAVPASGHILNMSRMSKIVGMRMTDSDGPHFSLIVQPGITLTDLNWAVSGKRFTTQGWDAESMTALAAFKKAGDYFFTPDPTEDTAAIGGMIACNASGARSYKYGPTRDYIRRLRIVSADGDILDLQRGQHANATGRTFALHGIRQSYKGDLPSYPLPDVKNASGYYAADDMDLIDLFIGSEGTLGIISEAELVLTPCPLHNWSIMAFFPSTANALDCAISIRNLSSATVTALEFFDENSISLLRHQRKENPAFKFLPELKDAWKLCIYVELSANVEDLLEASAMQISELIELKSGPESATWMATEASEIARMKKFRHALPEAVNLTIDTYRRLEPGITKLGTDFAVPDDRLREIMGVYISDLVHASLNYVIFGHIGNSHLHVNILPRNMQEYADGKALYLKWAQQVISMGGTVSAEHGIGKIKSPLLTAMYGKAGIAEMRAVKSLFDPGFRLNPGNLFEAD